jgi:hypothetical protein
MPEAAAPNPFSALSAPPQPLPAPAAAPAAKPLAQSTPVMSEPQRRWAEERARIVAPDPFQHDPTRTVIRRAEDGTLSAHPRTDPAAPTDPAKPGESQPQPAQTDGGKIRLAEGVELTEQELRDLVSFKAAEDSRKLSTPQPGAYELKFNDDFVLPQGTEWRWNADDPLLGQVREFASANGMTQSTFSKLLGLHAASQMRDMQEFAAAKAAEVQKLGDTANARVDAVKTWLKAMAPDHFAGLARVLERGPTAAD